jgi:DNA mismatch endonuclease (patch repair protein)
MGLAVTDFLSTETRSRVMSRIKSKDTKPELRLRRGLFAAGARGWRCHAKGVPGKPDICFGRTKVAVFVDGRFWHGHPEYFDFGKSGAYWDQKIRRTQERDRQADEQLIANGWTVLRFWDFEIEESLEASVRVVLNAIEAGEKDSERNHKLNWGEKAAGASRA